MYWPMWNGATNLELTSEIQLTWTEVKIELIFLRWIYSSSLHNQSLIKIGISCPFSDEIFLVENHFKKKIKLEFSPWNLDLDIEKLQFSRDISMQNLFEKYHVENRFDQNFEKLKIECSTWKFNLNGTLLYILCKGLILIFSNTFLVSLSDFLCYCNFAWKLFHCHHYFLKPQ